MSTRSWYTQDSVLQNLKFYPQGFVKKKVRRLYIPGMFTLMPRESNFSLLGNINLFLYNELVEKMLMFSAFHKKEKPIHVHFNIALDRMLLRSQASLL